MITHWENFVFILELKWLYRALTVLPQECSGGVEGLNKQCWDSLCLSQTQTGSTFLCCWSTRMQRKLNIPRLFLCACTQLLLTLNNDFWLKAWEPAQASFCSQARTLSSAALGCRSQHRWCPVSETLSVPPFPPPLLPTPMVTQLWATLTEQALRQEKQKRPFLAYEHLEELKGGWGAQPGCDQLYGQGSDGGDGAVGWDTTAEMRALYTQSISDWM